MKTAVLATLATASAVPIVAFSAITPPPGSDYDLWMKELAAKMAATEPAPDDEESAIEELQEVLDDDPAPSEPAPVDTHSPGMHHKPPQTGAAPLTPVIVNGVASLAAVSSGLDMTPLLNTGRTVARSGKPDVVGAFRFHCEPSHLAYADPVVYPGDRSGKSHLHLFFGNTKADADSTYESLRTTGDSTCVNAGNRSAYWEPALIQTNASGKDEVVMPHNLNIYYKRRPASDPWYRANKVIPVNLPRGLRFVFGWPDRSAQFKCIDPKTWRNVTSWSKDMQSVLARCAPGQQLDVSVSTPSCWDGKNLDSADHRSHMSYTRGGAEHGWVNKCPASHPYEIPVFTLQSMFTILPGDRVKTWRFASDMMQPGAKPGSTFHADWFGAWEDRIADTWQAWCINKLLNCSAGNLGNGTSMKESSLYRELKKRPPERLPIPKA